MNRHAAMQLVLLSMLWACKVGRVSVRPHNRRRSPPRQRPRRRPWIRAT